MKRLVFTLGVVAMSAMTLFGQGRVNFNNFAAGISPITIVGYSCSPSQGAPGDFLGSDYSIQLLWVAGTFANQAAFDAANPNTSASFPFFGTTGSAPTHGPTVDGAGLFDGGTISMNGPPGVYTMQARAWYNGGFYPTFGAALAATANPGRSQLFTVNATASPTPAPNTMVPSFPVGLLSPRVPEPSALAVASLGAACLLFFRRRK
jgi:hypothetical protein